MNKILISMVVGLTVVVAYQFIHTQSQETRISQIEFEAKRVSQTNKTHDMDRLEESSHQVQNAKVSVSPPQQLQWNDSVVKVGKISQEQQQAFERAMKQLDENKTANDEVMDRQQKEMMAAHDELLKAIESGADPERIKDLLESLQLRERQLIEQRLVQDEAYDKELSDQQTALLNAQSQDQERRDDVKETFADQIGLSEDKKEQFNEAVDNYYAEYDKYVADNPNATQKERQEYQQKLSEKRNNSVKRILNSNSQDYAKYESLNDILKVE